MEELEALVEIAVNHLQSESRGDDWLRKCQVIGKALADFSEKAICERRSAPGIVDFNEYKKARRKKKDGKI